MTTKFRATLRLFLSAAALFGAVTAFAQTKQRNPRSPINAIREKYMESVAAPKRDQVQAGVELEVQSYATELPGQLGRSTLLSTHLKYESGRGVWGGKGDLMFGRYTDLKYTVFSVQELYASFVPNDRFSMALGRKDEFWSDVDQNWDLGLWEPRYLEEPLRPVDQGITGLSAKFSDPGSTFEMVGYVSPVFIPTMSPPLSVRNGDFVSESRWNEVPPKFTEALGPETKLSYKLDIPELSKLVSKPGVGGRVSLGKSRAWGPWVSASAAEKPINMILLRYDYDLIGAKRTGTVDFIPAVSFHRLWGADAGWNFGAVRASVSYLEDRPKENLPVDEPGAGGIVRSEWAQQQPQPLQAYGAHLDWKIDGLLMEPVDLKLDYLTTSTAPTPDLNSKGEDKGSIRPHRLQFTNALQARANAMFRFGRMPLGLSVRALREFDQKGNVYTLEGKLWPTRALALSAGFDILGVDDSSATNEDDRFLNRFRANDRMFAGVSYVF